MKSRAQRIIDELENLSNKSKTSNISSSDAIDFLRQSISEATLETRRANNLTHAVEQVFNETQDAEMTVDNHTELIKKLSNMVEQFNSDLNRTRMQIAQDKLRMNKTYDEIESVKVLSLNKGIALQVA